MRCPSCGEIIVDGNRFCTNCGHPVGEELPLPDEDFGRPYESAAPAKSNNRFLYAVIALLAMLLLVLTYLVFGGQIMEKLHPSAPEALSAPVMTATPAPTAAPTLTPTPTPTPAPTPTPTPMPVPGEELENAIYRYLHAFISDVNSGDYWELYSAVQSGSPVETEQKEFVKKSLEIDREEDLLDYQVQSMTRVNENTCYVTVLEAYEIWQDDDPQHFTMKQRCTYQLNRQSNGDWLIYSFVEYEAFDQVEY